MGLSENQLRAYDLFTFPKVRRDLHLVDVAFEVFGFQVFVYKRVSGVWPVCFFAKFSRDLWLADLDG